MRGASRLGLWAGLVLLAAGVVLHAITGHGYGLLVIGALATATALLERRYRRPLAQPRLDDRWHRTDERFLDPESGEAMEVWFDGLTGERRYLPIAQRTDIIR